MPDVGSPIRASWGDDVEAEGVFTTYTPTLTAATTDPTLGTGAQRLGQYAQVNGLVICQVLIAFGTSGTNQGSGIYAVSLPITAAVGLGTSSSPLTELGSGTIQCAGSQSPIAVTISSAATGATVGMRYLDAAYNATAHTVASGVPGAWTANDFIRFSIMYRAA